MGVKVFMRGAFAAGMILLAGQLAAAAEPRVTIVPPRQGAEIVDAQVNAVNPGTIHLLYNQNTAPIYATSTDGGKTISRPMPVLAAKSPISGLEFSGWSMAVNDAGKVFVVMANNAWKLKLPKDQWGMFLAALEPGGKAFGPMINLNGLPSEGFSIAARENDVIATYLAAKLYWKRSSDSGKTFSANQEINPGFLPCNCCTTSAAIAKDGTLGVLYREATDDHRDMYVILSKPGQTAPPAHIRISQTLWNLNACPMTYFKIAQAGDGFVAAWPTRGQVYFTRFSTAGKIWTPGEIKVGGKTGMRSSVFVLAGANDTTLVAWKQDDTLHYRLFDGRGKAVGEEQSAAGAGVLAAGVVTREGDFILFP